MAGVSPKSSNLNIEENSKSPFSSRHRTVILGFKRFCDVFFSILILLVLSPVFLYIALRIKHDSPGPVLFKGDRMGRFGKPFKILKFRTMYEDERSYNGAPVTAEGDERITPFGKYLRETKLNELPQFWNVIKGEMSLVGPRPEDLRIAQGWPEEVKAEVLSVRPGITSPASVIYRDEETILKGSGFMDDYLKTILPRQNPAGSTIRAE